MEQDYVLISASNAAGENLIRTLQYKKIPFAVMINSKLKAKPLEKIGVQHILTVNTKGHNSWTVPPFPIGPVILFEESLALTCRYIKMCRPWTGKPIYVVTDNLNPRSIYRTLGADHVIFTNSQDVSFLVK